MDNKKIFSNNDFDSIYWHDSTLVSILFDQAEFSDVKLIIDLVLKSHPSKTSSDKSRYVLIQQPAVVKFLSVTNMKINLQWNEVILDPTFAYIEREKLHFSNNIDEQTFYKYIIEFNGTAEGNIILDKVPEFEMLLLGEPIIFKNEKDYIKKRNKIIKNNFDLVL